MTTIDFLQEFNRLYPGCKQSKKKYLSYFVNKQIDIDPSKENFYSAIENIEPHKIHTKKVIQFWIYNPKAVEDWQIENATIEAVAKEASEQATDFIQRASPGGCDTIIFDSKKQDNDIPLSITYNVWHDAYYAFNAN